MCYALFRAGPGDEVALKPNRQMARTYDFLFKFVLLGGSAVGKMSMVTRYAKDTFSSASISTMNI